MKIAATFLRMVVANYVAGMGDDQSTYVHSLPVPHNVTSSIFSNISRLQLGISPTRLSSELTPKTDFFADQRLMFQAF
jgi:hypothetical protein